MLGKLTTKSARRWMVALIVALVVAEGGLVLYARWRSAVEEHQAVLATTRLPDGVEAAWRAYVLKRLASTLVVQGNQIRIAQATDKLTGQSTVVSTSTPFEVNCDGVLGGTITFGSGDDAVFVPIFGPAVIYLDGSDKPPPLGVDPSSTAATSLNQQLCPLISDYMQRTGVARSQ